MGAGDPAWSATRELQGYEVNELHGRPVWLTTPDPQVGGINELRGQPISELPAYQH